MHHRPTERNGRAVKPRLISMQLGRDSLHMLGMFFFHDPDSYHPRQVNIEDADTESGYWVTPAGSQAHMPDTDVYTEEADRLLQGVSSELTMRLDTDEDAMSTFIALREGTDKVPLEDVTAWKYARARCNAERLRLRDERENPE